MLNVHVGLVGFGWWGRNCHAALIQGTPGLELTGVVSGSCAKRAEIQNDLGCRAYDSLELMLSDDSVEAVVLATPNHTHFDYARQALKAGKHVITDKPMCLSLQDCDVLIETARQVGRLLTTFQNRRLDGDFLTVQQLIKDGTLGELRWLEMTWSGYGAWGGWRGTRAQGGGKFLDLGAHMIDQALQLIQSPVVGVYLRTHHDFDESEVESEAFLVLEFASGSTAVCDTSSLTTIDKPRFYARGTNGTFQKFGLDPQEAALMTGDITIAQEDPANYGTFKGPNTERTIPTLPGNWSGFYENFAASVRGEVKIFAPPEQTRRVMAIFEAAWRSVRERQFIRCDI